MLNRSHVRLQVFVLSDPEAYTVNLKAVEYAVFACYNVSPLTPTVQSDAFVSILPKASIFVITVKTSKVYRLMVQYSLQLLPAKFSSFWQHFQYVSGFN